MRDMATLLAEPRYWRALAALVKPSVEHRRALRHLQPRTVIDVGANKGQFAYLANSLWPQARIVSFEPLPRPRDRLASLMGKRITIHDCALGETEGAATIHIASREDSSSLLPLGRQSELFQMREVGVIKVPVRRLDDVMTESLSRPALLKVDVQGFEYEVLKGASRLLEQIDWVYVEASFIELYHGQRLAVDVVELLAVHGFQEVGRYNELEDAGKVVQADILFASREVNK